MGRLVLPPAAQRQLAAADQTTPPPYVPTWLNDGLGACPFCGARRFNSLNGRVAGKRLTHRLYLCGTMYRRFGGGEGSTLRTDNCRARVARLAHTPTPQEVGRARYKISLARQFGVRI